MNDYLLTIRLLYIALFVFFFGSLLIAAKLSKRTGKSFLRILLGLDRRVVAELGTPREKLFIAFLFVFPYFLGYLSTKNIKTIADIVAPFLKFISE